MRTELETPHVPNRGTAAWRRAGERQRFYRAVSLYERRWRENEIEGTGGDLQHQLALSSATPSDFVEKIRDQTVRINAFTLDKHGVGRRRPRLPLVNGPA